MAQGLGAEAGAGFATMTKRIIRSVVSWAGCQLQDAERREEVDRRMVTVTVLPKHQQPCTRLEAEVLGSPERAGRAVLGCPSWVGRGARHAGTGGTGYLDSLCVIRGPKPVPTPAPRGPLEPVSPITCNGLSPLAFLTP